MFQISGYLEKEWSCKHEISANPPELSVWTFQSYDSAQRITLDLGMHCINENGSLKFALYCPFWMLNKTGLMLSYRVSFNFFFVLFLFQTPNFKIGEYDVKCENVRYRPI